MKLYVLSLAFLMCAYFVNAQAGLLARGEGPELNLTEEQKEELQSVKTQFISESRKIRNSEDSEDEKHQAMTRLRDERDENVDQILTSEQRKALEEYKALRIEELKLKREKQLEALNLTETQEEQVRILLDDHKEEMRTIQASSLAIEEKRAQIFEANKNLDIEIERILSSEQYQMWKSNKPTRQDRRKTKGRRPR